jgi:N-acetylgalactosamine-6-sulfatase
MRPYLADVYALDLNVGRVLDIIDELGIRDNPIVVFSSDHCPAPVVAGKKGARTYSNNMLGYAGTLRGGKHEQYEGGIRVPFIIRWPDRVPSQKWNQTPLSTDPGRPSSAPDVMHRLRDVPKTQRPIFN